MNDIKKLLLGIGLLFYWFNS